MTGGGAPDEPPGPPGAPPESEGALEPAGPPLSSEGAASRGGPAAGTKRKLSSVTEAITELMRESARLPDLVQAALLDPAQAGDVTKELSAELPAALYESLGLLPGGSRHLLKPVDFLEGGKVDRQLVGDGVWLGPQQETVQRPLDSKPHTRVPADADGLKDELCRLKAAMRVELGRTVPGTTILRSMADAAFSLAEDIRKAGLSAAKRAEAERRRRPKTSKVVPLQEMLDTVRTGDLVLMQSEAFTARFVTHALRCEYAHLAVVVRLPKLPGTVLLLEADPEAHFVESCGDTAWHLQLIDARSRLSSWLDGATNSLAFRQLSRPVGAVEGASSDALLKLLCPPTMQWDTPGLAAAKVNHMQALLQALYGLRFAADYADLNAMEGIDSLRSAEMACLAYQALGALSDELDPSSLTLADFNRSPPLEIGYSLGPAIGVAPFAQKDGALPGGGQRPSERIAQLTDLMN